MYFVFIIKRKTSIEKHCLWVCTVGKQDLQKCFSLSNTCGCCYVAVNNIIREEVSKYEKQYRGKELLGFVNYKTFQAIVQQYMDHLVGPALDMLQKIVGEHVSPGALPAPPVGLVPRRERLERSDQTACRPSLPASGRRARVCVSSIRSDLPLHAAA